jgi:hypothetical protein
MKDSTYLIEDFSSPEFFNRLDSDVFYAFLLSPLIPTKIPDEN